jgi:hypothetical protein
MTKAAVTRLFLGSIIAVVAALVLGFVAVWAAFAGGVFVMDGPDVVDVTSTPFAWAMFGLMALSVVAVIGGAVAGLVAWVGALINTAQMPDKAWFVILLLLGLFSFGFVAMIAYVIAGPDGMQASAVQPARGAPAAQPGGWSPPG